MELFGQAIVAVEPLVVQAFGDLVCRCLAGNEDALERMPALKSVVSSYIQLHDCSFLFSEFLPQEATRSATQRMCVQPADDRTALYTCPRGLEETMLKVGSCCRAHQMRITCFCRQSRFGSSVKSAKQLPLIRSRPPCLQLPPAPPAFAPCLTFSFIPPRCPSFSTCSMRSWYPKPALFLFTMKKHTQSFFISRAQFSGASGGWMAAARRALCRIEFAQACIASVTHSRTARGESTTASCSRPPSLLPDILAPFSDS